MGVNLLAHDPAWPQKLAGEALLDVLVLSEVSLAEGAAFVVAGRNWCSFS